MPVIGAGADAALPLSELTKVHVLSIVWLPWSIPNEAYAGAFDLETANCGETAGFERGR